MQPARIRLGFLRRVSAGSGTNGHTAVVALRGRTPGLELWSSLAAGVCPGARLVDPAGGSLVATFPDVDPPPASLPPSRHAPGLPAPTEDHAATPHPGGVGDGGPSAVPDGGGSHLSDHCPGEAVGPSYRQREQSRRHRRRRAKRNAATATPSLR